MGEDLKRFFADVKSQTQDTRFDDAEYLASKFVVWQANEYKRTNMLDFLSIGICLKDHGDIEYLYEIDCDKHDNNGFPIVTIKEV